LTIPERSIIWKDTVLTIAILSLPEAKTKEHRHMTTELLKANLNLYAVLKNLEDLVRYDEEMAAMAKNWNLSIQFIVKGGPKAHVTFKNGSCRVERGLLKLPSVALLFTSPEHLNRMFDGKGNPIPIKGFTRLGFMTKKFPKLTEKLEHYLKPNDELLKDQKYLQMNTRLTLNTAAWAVKELSLLDPPSMACAQNVRDGTVLLKVLPDGPAVHIRAFNGQLEPGKGDVERPMARMLMRNQEVANAFLNGKMDTFAAVVSGDVAIRGQVSMLDNLAIILDRIPFFLN